MIILQLLSFAIIFIILCYSNINTRPMFWLRAFFLLACMLSFMTYLRDDLLPTITNLDVKRKLTIVMYIMRGVSAHLMPYTGLIYSILHSEVLINNKRLERAAYFILAIPPAVMFFVFPIYPKYEPPFLVLSLFAVPYIFTAIVLIIIAYVNENNPFLKKQKLLVVYLVVPQTIFLIISNFILRSIDHHELWKYNAEFAVLSLLVFVVFLSKHGMLGVQLKIERNITEHFMKSKTSGTAILNHTIKNEVFKVNMCLKNIRRYTDSIENRPQYVDESINIVIDSMNFLSQMTKNIQGKIGDINLNLKNENLKEIVSEVILVMNPLFANKNIKIVNMISQNIRLNVDKILIKEVLQNIFKNSLDATPLNGVISVDINEYRKDICLIITDTGTGISKENMSLIFEPFFTTKMVHSNYGLGLYFCYLIIKKHNGNIEFKSKEGMGTSVYITFPKNKMISKNARREVCESGYNQNFSSR